MMHRWLPLNRLCLVGAGILLSLAVSAKPLHSRLTHPSTHYLLIDLDKRLGNAWAVNDQRVVVGTAKTSPNKYSAVSWLANHGRTVKTLAGGEDADAWGINNAGQICGNISPQNTYTHAAIWKNGVLKDLGTLGGSNSYATAIGENGWVVGASETADAHRHACVWINEKAVDLGSGEATSVNSKGDVVIIADSHGFVWHNGRKKDLGNLGGPIGKYFSINDAGDMAGLFDTVQHNGNLFSHHTIACISHKGHRHFLKSRYGKGSVAKCINNHGQIVGSIQPAKGNPRAAIWQGEINSDLNQLIPPHSDYELNDAVWINDNGWICCQALRNGERRAVLLIPQ